MHLPLTAISGGAATGPWEYATLSAAESSGDPWVNGDQVTITGGAVFLYIANAAVSGYSGLLHKEPYGASITTLSAATVVDSEAEGVDPDSWTNWTDGGTGTKGVDYEHDTNGGLARIRDLTIAGQCSLTTDARLTTDDLERYSIVDKITATTTGTAAVEMHSLSCIAVTTVPALAFIKLRSREDGNSIYWQINHTDGSTIAISTKDRRVQQRAWMYVKTGRWALWFDADSTPELSGTVPRPIAYTPGANPDRRTIVGAAAASTGVSTLTQGLELFGRMTTA